MLVANELLYLTLCPEMARVQHLIYKNAKGCLTMRNMAPFQVTVFYKLNQTDCSFSMTGLSVNILPKMWFYGLKSEPNSRSEFNLCGGFLPSVFSRVRFCHRTNVPWCFSPTNAPRPPSSLSYPLGRTGTQTWMLLVCLTGVFAAVSKKTLTRTS